MVKRQIGLIGPSASGKTQFKVFLLSDGDPPPRYLSRLYRVRKDRSVDDSVRRALRATSENANLEAIEFKDGRAFQQRHRPTKELHRVVVRYRDPNETSLPAVETSVCDFPGEYFNPSFTSPSKKSYDEELPERREALNEMSELIVIVPFWHLLAPGHLRTLIADKVIDPAANDRMSTDMDFWLTELERLAVDASAPRRIVLALSQVGGSVLIKCQDALEKYAAGNHDAEGGIESLNLLVQLVARLDELDWADKVTFGALWRAIEYLRRMEHAAWSLVRAGHRGGNATAGRLVAIGRSRLEFLAFNVVDDVPIPLTVRDQKSTFFRQEPLNPHLVLLRFWQDAVRDVCW